MSTPGTSLYVNADWSALVPAGSPEAAFGLTVEEAGRRGLLVDDGPLPKAPVTISSANVAPAEPAPEPEAKEAEKPADKAASIPANKAARKPRRPHEDSR